MATKSVTKQQHLPVKTADEVFGDLVQRMENLRNAPRTNEQVKPATPQPEAETERALAAFSGFDSSVFSGGAAAVADLMASELARFEWEALRARA